VTTHHPTRAQNLRTYKPLEHQHVPEIEGTLRAAGGRDVSVAFVPVSAPLTRGIFATAFARVPASVSESTLKTAMLEYYAAEGHANPLRIELPRGGYAPLAGPTQ